MGRKAQNNVTLLGGRSSWPIIARAPVCRTGVSVPTIGISPTGGHGALTVDHGYSKFDVETRNRL